MKILEKKVFFGVAGSFLFLGFLLFTGLVMAKELYIVNPASETPSSTPVSIPDSIQKGLSILKATPPLDYETKSMKLKKGQLVKTGDLVRKQIELAILNKNTGEIFEKRVWVREQDIKNYKKTGVLNFENSSSSDGLTVRPQWWNSFNTFYEVVDRPEMVVVANKYLFPSKYLTGLAEKSAGEYTDIVYVPYSKQIHLPEVVELGKNYLEKNINKAFEDLNTLGVRSTTSSAKLITQDISKDFVRNIILVEHVDPDGFEISDDGGRELFERALAVIGANQKLAFRYTGSPAGASGLAQFIKPTYLNMVRKYPQAKLIKDYNLGMADHVNAIKAMVLFFDSHKQEISTKTKRQDIVRSLGITEEMLAATYNGGPGKVVKSVNKYGTAWFDNQLGLKASARILRQETISYVKKFEAIKGLNLFAGISIN